MPAIITPERPDTAEARVLIAELEAELAPFYPQESRHGYSVERLLADAVAFFLIREDGTPAGCGGVKLAGADYAEVKRMYVRPQFRGLGLARLMLNHLADYAQSQGIGVLRLETGIHQRAAIGLYERMGFQQIPAFAGYKEDPLSRFYEKRLQGRSGKYMTPSQISYSLIEADDSVLVAIDIQDAFLDKLPPQESGRLLSRACWLIAIAQWKGIPLVVTAEELHQQPLAPKLVESLPPGTPIFDKASLGLAHQPDILAAVGQTGRKTAILIGLETDVCVAQSALGLIEQGYRVAVVADATGTPAPGQEIGLNRMQNAGAIIVSAKSLFYEWLRTVEMVNRFYRECPNIRNWDGIVL